MPWFHFTLISLKLEHALITADLLNHNPTKKVMLLYEKCFKVIGIRPMAPVLTQVHLNVSEQEMLSFSVRKEIFKNDNSLVVILLSKVVESEFLQTL